jgi:hypothetical protein
MWLISDAVNVIQSKIVKCSTWHHWALVAWERYKDHPTCLDLFEHPLRWVYIHITCKTMYMNWSMWRCCAAMNQTHASAISKFVMITGNMFTYFGWQLLKIWNWILDTTSMHIWVGHMVIDSVSLKLSCCCQTCHAIRGRGMRQATARNNTGMLLCSCVCLSPCACWIHQHQNWCCCRFMSHHCSHSLCACSRICFCRRRCCCWWALGVVAEAAANACSIATHIVAAVTAATIAAVVFDATDEVDVAQYAHSKYSNCNLHVKTTLCCSNIGHGCPV